MASRDGASTVLKLVKALAKIVAIKGVPARLAAFNPPLATALTALVGVVSTIQAVDDYLLEIDRSAPLGPEDNTGGSSEGPF